MKTIYENPLYDFILNDDENVLIFQWKETTADMTDEDFIKAISNYASFAFKNKGKGLLVDVRKFQHKIGKEALTWRNEVCLCRYQLAGVDKMGYVMPTQALQNLPIGDVKIGQFTDRYFDSHEAAVKWLSN